MVKKVPKIKKDMSVNELAKLMQQGFVKLEHNLEKKIDDKIDALAMATAKGFEKVDERFDEIDKRFDRVEKKIDELDTRHTKEIQTHRDRINVIYTTFDKKLNIKLPK